MTFDLDPNSDMHPEDQEAAMFALPIGDQHPELNTAVSAEMAAFDAIDTHFGTPDLGEWWENE